MSVSGTDQQNACVLLVWNDKPVILLTNPFNIYFIVHDFTIKCIPKSCWNKYNPGMMNSTWAFLDLHISRHWATLLNGTTRSFKDGCGFVVLLSPCARASIAVSVLHIDLLSVLQWSLIEAALQSVSSQ